MAPIVDDRYLRWQQKLSDTFLVGQEGPVVLFIDDAELRRIAPELDDAADDLALAVRNLSCHTPGAYFSRVERAHQLWKLGDKIAPPPTLPVLALSVLAATRMRSDGHALSTNYYWRFAESIDPEADPTQVTAMRDEVAGPAFHDVVSMWISLDEWITSQGGRIGTSTIRTHERLTRVGYPQSQALLTLSDRAELTRFFMALDVGEARLPDEQTILGALEIWTTRSQNRLSDTLMAALKDDQTKGLIAAVVLAFAAAWDGRVITRDGRRRIAVRLGLDLEEWTTEWLFPVQEDAVSPIMLDGLSAADRPVSLSQQPPDRYYVVEQSPPVSSALIRQGFRLRGSHFSAEFPKAEILIFARDGQTGAWSSVAGITPFETHVIAATSTESSAVSRVLARAADDGWTTRRQGSNPLLLGFTLFEAVKFRNDSALQSALGEEPGLRALGVAPTLVPRARLVRGLPIDRQLAPNHYLLGGDPDILLPTPLEPDSVVVSLNGIEDLIMANGFPFQVRRLLFPEGDVDVIVDGQSLRFTLQAESALSAPPQGTGALGWSEDGKLTAILDETRVVGAIAEGPADAPVALCRRGRDETWLLLDGGELRRCIEPGVPAFTHGAGLPFEPAFFEVQVCPSAKWLAQRTGPSWHLVRLVPGSPRDVKASFDVIGTWSRAAADASGATFWDLQLELASG